MLAWVHEGDDEQEEALVVHTGRMSRSKGKAAEVEPKNAWIDQNKLHTPTHADLEAAIPHKCREGADAHGGAFTVPRKFVDLAKGGSKREGESVGRRGEQTRSKRRREA
jgi:hypothetical protein